MRVYEITLTCSAPAEQGPSFYQNPYTRGQCKLVALVGSQPP